MPHITLATDLYLAIVGINTDTYAALLMGLLCYGRLVADCRGG
jgi:hypothetical protein